MKGIHKDTKTFFNKEKFIRKDLLNDLNWLENKDEFLKLYDKIIKEEEFTGTVNKKVISSKIFKDFIEYMLSGNINDINKKEIYKKDSMMLKIISLNQKKVKNVNQLKGYLTKIKDFTCIKDRIMKQDLLKIKEEKHTLIYLFFCLKCILIIIQKK